MSKLSLLKTTIGVIGNQNANVTRLIYEAHRLGIKVGVYTDNSNSVARDADFKIIGKFNDKNQLKEFANKCQIVIYVDGSGIRKGLIDYLRQYTAVPQGSEVLDLINDRAILRVILDSVHINSLPYKTVFSLSDVKQSLDTSDGTLYLRPVQTSYVEQRSVLIADPEQLDNLRHIFNGEAYLLEVLPKQARYFKLTFIKSRSGIASLPVIEEHYSGQQLKSADLNPQLSSNVSNQFHQITLNLANHIHYTGILTMSLILTPDDHVYVDGIELPFNLINNIYNLTPDNIYRTFFRVIFGAPIHFKSLHQTWLLDPIDQHDVNKVQKLWIDNNLSNFNLSSMINNNQIGYALMSADTLGDIKKQLQKDRLQLNHLDN